jgi:hypothetical protein
MRKYALLFAVLALASCTAPSLAQRQANWQRFVSATQATWVVGMADPAMPGNVRAWCSEVTAP